MMFLKIICNFTSVKKNVGCYLPPTYFNIIIVTVTERSQVHPLTALYSVESVLQLNTELLPAHSLCLLIKLMTKYLKGLQSVLLSGN